MDKIQKVLIKLGRKDLAQEYYLKITSKTAGLEKHLEMAMDALGFKHKSVDWEIEYDNAGKPILTIAGYNEKKYKDLAQKLRPDFNAKFVKDHLVLLPLKRFGKKAAVENDFQEKMDKILEAIEDAIQLVHNSGNRNAYERAKAYWYPHIKEAVDKKSFGYGSTGSMVDMAETLKEISGSLDDELISRYKAELKKHGIGISKVEKSNITLEVLPDANVTDETTLLDKAHEIADKIGINPGVGIDF